MKRMLSLFLLILLLCNAAQAELILPIITPTPSPVPAGQPFSCDPFRLTLPHGMEILDVEAFAAYEAAIHADYPSAAETLLAAADEQRAIFFAAIESAAEALTAAQEAAQLLLGDASIATESPLGQIPCASFGCAIGDQSFNLYFFSHESQIIVAGLSGLTETETTALLRSLHFH